MRLPDPIGVYAILDAGTMPPDDLPAAAVAMAQAGVRVFQVRGKALPGGALVRLVAEVRDALGPEPVLLVNDRVDVAAVTPCDGVHLGDEDLPVTAARAILPAGAIVGVSTHSPDDAATDHGADYIGVGPIFETSTKPTGRPTLGADGLRRAAERAPVPVVAIGGIRTAEVPTLRRAGASGIAMIGALLVPGEVGPRAKAAVAAFTETQPTTEDGA